MAYDLGRPGEDDALYSTEDGVIEAEGGAIEGGNTQSAKVINPSKLAALITAGAFFLPGCGVGKLFVKGDTDAERQQVQGQIDASMAELQKLMNGRINGHEIRLDDVDDALLEHDAALRDHGGRLHDVEMDVADLQEQVRGILSDITEWTQDVEGSISQLRTENSGLKRELQSKAGDLAARLGQLNVLASSLGAKDTVILADLTEIRDKIRSVQEQHHTDMDTFSRLLDWLNKKIGVIEERFKLK